MKNEVAKDFINYVMSEEGQKIVSDNGYIPVDGAKPYSGKEVSGKVVVGGSSSVSPVMEKLIEGYKAVNSKANVELQTTDSTTGMTSTIDGSYDIGMASRDLKDDEAAKLQNTVIATDGIAVIVNKNNTTDELSADQVKTIYTGDATTWDEVVK
jgi:phosphate transport system substrate-binding protein